jgi:hypothetical protein
MNNYYLKVSSKIFLTVIISTLFTGTAFSQSNTLYASKVDAGFIFYDGQDIESNLYQSAIGPFFEARQNTNGNTFIAVHPFYSLTKSNMDDRILHEYLWPIGMHKTFRGQSYWRFLLAYGMNFDVHDPESRYRYSLFPLIFGGRDIYGDGYFAFFPFGGSIHEILGQDKVSFVLFPLYFTHQIKNVKTTTYLWPIFSKTTGDEVQRHGVFPFYGYSNNENLNQWTKKYVLWPFWTHTTYKAPGPEGYAYILFPLFGRAKVGTNTKTLMLLPPFFRFSTGEYRGKKHVERNCPWPFVRYVSGEEEKFYIWPIWGHRNKGNEKKWFAAWPIMFSKTLYRRSYFAKRFLIIPFYQNESRYLYTNPGNTQDRSEWGQADKAIYRNMKVWPLFNYQRMERSSRLRVLDLWPFKSARSVDRNYSSLWTIYSHSRVENKKEDKILWGLFRWRRDNNGNKDLRLFPLYSDNKKTLDDTNTRKWNILYGLLGYEREGLQKKFRLLYFLKFKYGTNGSSKQE